MAWKRQRPEPRGPAAATPRSAVPVAPPQSRRETGMESKNIVNIGQSVQIKGELAGNEDLTIEGMVDGKISLKDHNLTIGANGRITAEIHAKTVMIIGQVIGNITADDKVQLAETGSVQGDIRAPRVAIADGARFKGSIDMDRKSPGASGTQGATPARDVPRSAGVAEL